MLLSLIRNKLSLILFGCVLTFLVSLSAHGFERGPIVISIGPPNFYKSSSQSACEYAVHAVASGLISSPYNFLLSPAISDILEILITPADQNGYPISSGPVYSYFCSAKISQYMGPSVPRAIGTVNNVTSAYPVCNIGDFPSAVITSETICNISGTIPDKGVNAGQPQLGSCIGNPVNTSTGNKYAEEIDIASTGSLSFSRYYNSTSLAGGLQIGSTWRHSYQSNLNINAQTISASRPDGKLAYFRLTGSVWMNQQAGGDTLLRYPVEVAGS